MTGRKPRGGHLEAARAMAEAQLQAAVIGQGRACGWLVHHSRAVAQRRHDGSVRHLTPLAGNPGCPDLLMVHADPLSPAVVLAELKRQTGQLDPPQVPWAAALTRAPGVLYVVWRPLDLIDGTIGDLLAHPEKVTALARLPQEAP